jgi:hypothetical protein
MKWNEANKLIRKPNGEEAIGWNNIERKPLY